MNLRKNLTLEGIFSVETPDTSGEVLDVKGADISDLESGKAPLNTEHINPEDAEKSELHKENGEFKGFNAIIGRVVNAKKLFSENDCKSENELNAWNNFRKPMIYGTVEIWDGPDAHDNARAAASIARMFNKSQEGPQLGLSVEGSTIKRDGNLLKQTVIRRMALTMKPANKAATIDIVSDSSLPKVSKSAISKTNDGGIEPLRKSVSMQNISVFDPMVINDFGLSKALANLKKTLSAGMTNSAPGSLTGGSALQKESQLAKLVKLVGKKLPSRDEIKKAIPGISEEDAEKVEKAFRKKNLRKNEEMMQEIYSKMVNKK